MMYTHVATALIAAAVSATGAWQVQNWRFDTQAKQRLEAQAELRRTNEKAARDCSRRPILCCCARSTLTGLVALLRLVDHIDAAFTAHDLAIAMTVLQRAERVCNFHRSISLVRGASSRQLKNVAPVAGNGEMVGGTGIEPVATTMST